MDNLYRYTMNDELFLYKSALRQMGRERMLRRWSFWSMGLKMDCESDNQCNIVIRVVRYRKLIGMDYLPWSLLYNDFMLIENIWCLVCWNEDTEKNYPRPIRMCILVWYFICVPIGILQDTNPSFGDATIRFWCFSCADWILIWHQFA